MQLKPIKIEIENPQWDKIEISNELVSAYALDKWAENFSLMTAGYRDQLDPDDAFSPDVPLNVVTIAILGEAKARVFRKKYPQLPQLHVHIGGETRPHTQTFIAVLARVYAANGCKVHLRAHLNTTPIWYSSFGVFYEQYHSGDNLTASHSQFFKGGWKPMDHLGKQLVEEEDDIIEEVKRIVAAAENKTVTIALAPWTCENIVHDFDVDDAYISYQGSIIDDDAVAAMIKPGEKRLRCAICTVGGSMRPTTERLFKRLNIPVGDQGIIHYFFDEEDPRYHNIGQINGQNYGVDPTKEEIYRHLGAQERLLNNQADIVFIWDPDGDRFNMVTTAPSKNKNTFSRLGLNVESGDGDRCIVYFTPNQIYLMLVAFRIARLKKMNLFDAYDWFIASSVTTSRALDELAAKSSIPIVHVKVGFKWWGTFAAGLERGDYRNSPYVTALGETVNLGTNPRLIIMCEESGGAVFGGWKPLFNRNKSVSLIAMREKDGFQIGLLSLALAAELHSSDRSFAEYYCEIVESNNIMYRHFQRYDKTLYDESKSGMELQRDKQKGAAQRDRVMHFFHQLSEQCNIHRSLDRIHRELNKKVPHGYKSIPPPLQVRWIGDTSCDEDTFNQLEGAFLQFDTFWFVIRASGTDAVLRYYFNGRDIDEIEAYANSFRNLRI